MDILDIQRISEIETPSDKQLLQWYQCLLQLLREQQRCSLDNIEITLRIVDIEEIKQLNRDYRGKDTPTNILSFPFDPPPEVSLPLLGDLVVCAKVVMTEAREQGKDLSSHWVHLLIHGVLHLLGYDHQEEEEAEQMENLEITLLEKMGYVNPY